MNNNNSFLQLRQATAENVYQNGDYHTQLKKPIVLESGDQLILNKCFVDSASADSGNIVLEKETEIGFYFNYYVINSATDQKYTDYARTTGVAPSFVDGEQYMLCSKHTISGYEIVELTGIEYKVTSSPTNEKFIANIEYIEATTGQTVNRTIEMDLDNTGIVSYKNKNTIAIRARKQTGQSINDVFKDTTPNAVLQENDTDKSNRTLTTTTISTNDYEPVLEKVSVNLPAGNYSPSDFAERFTRLITLQREGIFNRLTGTSKNPLLKSTSDLASADEPAFVRVNGGDKVFYYGGTAGGGDTGAGTARFIGTNQFVLEYDEGTSRFKLSQTHFPQYNSSGKMEVKFVKNQNSSLDFDLISAHSGVAFTAFFSLQGGNDIRLWDDILGFDTHRIIAIPTNYVSNATLSTLVPTYGGQLEIAQQITTGNRGMDVGVIKTSAITVPDMLVAVGVSTEITEMEPIFASKDFETTNLTFGYYLISIEGGVIQDLVTNTNIHTDIFSIISRYYQNNNYTTGNSADACIYQHVGAPAYVNSLRVRVLNSSYNVPTDLGEDNTVFLQLVKASIPAEQQHTNKVR